MTDRQQRYNASEKGRRRSRRWERKDYRRGYRAGYKTGFARAKPAVTLCSCCGDPVLQPKP